MRDAFMAALTEQAQQDSRVNLIIADIGFKVVDDFVSKMPDQFLNVGIAEQTMIGVAAGLLRTGLVKPASIVALASSAIAGLIALYDMINIDQFGDGYIAGASIGFGLLLVGFAAFIGFVTALVELLAAFGVLAAKQSDSA